MNHPLHALLWALAFIAITMAVTPGCSRLPYHPKKMVSIPSGAGVIVGTIAGIPLCVVFLPITLPIQSIDHYFRGNDADFDCIYPLAAPTYLCATALGGPSWLIFGWWGLPQESANYYEEHFGSAVWAFTPEAPAFYRRFRAYRLPEPSQSTPDAIPDSE